MITMIIIIRRKTKVLFLVFYLYLILLFLFLFVYSRKECQSMNVKFTSLSKGKVTVKFEISNFAF